MSQYRPPFVRFRAMQQALAFFVVICLTLPNPVFALRQAGLEENAAKQEFLEQIEAPQKTPLNQSGVKEGKSLRNQHQRNQLIALLREHAGGPLDVEEFAQLIGIKKRRLLKLGIEDLISQENARRTTPPPLIIGVHSSPLPAPIKVKPTRKVKPARDIEKAIRDALRSHPGGRLTSKELVKLSGVGKTALFITYNYKALVVEENARRANEIPPRPPIVPLGRNMGRIAIVTALRAHPGGWLRRAELARLAEVKVDMLERHKWRSLVSEENAQRAKERPPRPAIVIDTQTAIIAALAAHPGGPLTVRDLADFAGINLHNNTLPNNSNYRSLVAEENIRRTAEVPPRTPIEIVRQRPSRHSSSFVQTHASIVSALEAFPGGPLTFNQLERSAGVSRQTLRNHDYKRLVDEENARRVTQTPLRLPITLVPPTGTSATLTSGLKENGDKDEVAEYARAVASLEEKLRGLAHRGVAIPTSLTRQTDGKPVRFMGDYRLVDLLREDGESTEELSVEGKEVLILASSTGAYPIAAWRLNAKRVVGIDLDPVSVRVAQFVSGYLHDPNIRAIFDDEDRSGSFAPSVPFTEAVDLLEKGVTPRVPQGLEFLVADARQLPIPDDSFDLIVVPWLYGIESGLTTLDDVAKSFAELIRVGRKGAKIRLVPIPPQEGVANQLTPVFSQLVPDWFDSIGKVGGKSIEVLSITNVHTPIISENMPVAWSPAVTFLIQGKQTLTESATGLEEVAKWLQSLGIWSKPLEATQLIDLQAKGEMIAEVRGVPSLVRLTTVTQEILPSTEISRGRQVIVQSDLLPDQTLRFLAQRFGAVEPLPRSLSPEAITRLVTRLKDLDTQGPKAMLLVDPETAEQIKTVLAEVDPEWKIPVLIVGIPKGLLDTIDPDAILTYLLNLLAQVDQIPGRHIERLEATLTLEAKHQTLFLSSGA